MKRETFISDAHARRFRAGRIELGESMSVAEGFDTVISSCVQHFRQNAQLVVERRMPEALHQSRVALRRLRSALSLFEVAAGGRDFRRFEEELRFLGAVLGEARNLDVYLRNDLPEDERAALEERRDEAYNVAAAVVDSAHTRRLLADLQEWAVAGKWRRRRRANRPLKPFVDRQLDRLWKKMARSRRVARMGERARHHLRIRVKKLRYGLDFARDLHRRHKKRRKAFENTLKELQEALGQLNDAVVARGLKAQPAWPLAAPREPPDPVLLRHAEAALKQLRRTGAYW